MRLNLASLNPALWKLCSAEVAIQDGHFPVTLGSALGRWGVRNESGAVLMETSFSPNGSESMGFAYQEYPGLAGGPLFPPEFGAREKYQGNHDIAIYRVRFLIPPGTTNEALLFGTGSNDSFASSGVNRVSVSQLPESASIVRFRDRTLNVIENSGAFELVLERLGNLAPSLDVEVHSRPLVESSSPILPAWHKSSFTVHFGPGESRATLTFPIEDNHVPDPIQWIQFSLGDVQGSGVAGDISESFVQLLDDESGMRFAPQPAYVSESVGVARLPLEDFGNVPGNYVVITELGEGNDLKVLPTVRGEGLALEVVNDAVVRADRYQRVTIRHPLTGAPAQTLDLLILDDDVAGAPPAGNPPPQIIPQRTVSPVLEGRSLRLDPSIPPGNWRFLWTRNGVPLLNETRPVLELLAAGAAEDGEYLLLLRGAQGFTASRPMRVRVLAPSEVPTLTGGAAGTGGVVYRFQVPTGVPYHLERSVELAPWERSPVTVRTAADGALEFAVPPQLPSEYFRVVLEE